MEKMMYFCNRKRGEIRLSKESAFSLYTQMCTSTYYRQYYCHSQNKECLTPFLFFKIIFCEILRNFNEKSLAISKNRYTFALDINNKKKHFYGNN